MKLTVKACVPTLRIVPLDGLYTNEPATAPLDALSCAEDSAVPYVMALGLAQVRVGVAWATTSETVPVAVS